MAGTETYFVNFSYFILKISFLTEDGVIEKLCPLECSECLMRPINDDNDNDSSHISG